MIICQSNEQNDQEAECTRTLFASRVDGVISSVALHSTNYDHFRVFTQKNIPIVFFDRVCDEIETCKVVVDDFMGGFMAAEHLISMGCKRIAHIGGPQHLNIYINRLQGFLKALRKHNIQIDRELIIFNDLSRKGGAEAARKLMTSSAKPDAIFAGNDTAALSAILYAREKKIKIPGELAVVGFSNEPFSEFISPSLTTIEQSGFEVGKRATELLVEMIQNEDVDQHKTIVLPVDLIQRESSARL